MPRQLLSSAHNSEAPALRHWLAHGRGLWIALTPLTAGSYIASLPTFHDLLQTICTTGDCAQWRLSPEGARERQEAGINTAWYAAVGILLSICAAGMYFAVAGLLFWRRSDEWIALLLPTLLVLFGPGGDYLVQVGQGHPFLAFLGTTLGYLTTILFIPLSYFFPDGHFVPRWTWAPSALWVALEFPYYYFPDSPYNPWNWSTWFSAPLFLGYYASIALAQIYRYRRISGTTERQQTKWVVLALAMVIICWNVLAATEAGPLPLRYREFAGLLINPISVLLSVAIGISILRYRLYDIDVLINRTMVYGLLTVSLAAVYFGGVALLQGLLRALTGQGSALAVVGSTLAVAALFQPLRRRLQAAIDRRFYRRKYDAQRMLTALSATLRDETDLDHLSAALVAVVEETMRPAHASLWLRPTERRGQASGRSRNDVVTIP